MAMDAVVSAAAQGHTQHLLELLKQGSDVNTTTPNGNTPAMMAAANGALDCLDILIEHGAKLNHTNKNGDTGDRK